MTETSGQVGCADAVRRLWEYLDGELDVEGSAALEAHLAWCRRCCGELALAHELRRVLREKTATGVPDGALARLTSFVDELDECNDDGSVLP